MRVSGWKSAMGAACGILGIAVLLSATAGPPAAQSTQTAVKEVTLDVDPAQSKVHYVVDTTLHTVHGTFATEGRVGRAFRPGDWQSERRSSCLRYEWRVGKQFAR